MSQELSILKKILKEKSVAQIAVELGYRSPNTVVVWLKNRNISSSGRQRLKDYVKNIK